MAIKDYNLVFALPVIVETPGPPPYHGRVWEARTLALESQAPPVILGPSVTGPRLGTS